MEWEEKTASLQVQETSLTESEDLWETMTENEVQDRKKESKRPGYMNADNRNTEIFTSGLVLFS